MSEVRLVRTLAVPLAIAFVFLVFTPKLCERAIVNVRKQQVLAPQPAAETRTGLVIQSSTPAQQSAANLRFPPGLDVARIQYLVEIDRSYAEPLKLTASADPALAKILLDRGYVDQNLAPTREGLINVNGAVQTADGWAVPVAGRKFLGVERIDDAGDNRYDISVRWRWEPTPIAASLLSRPTNHTLKAQFAGGERNWVLASYIWPPDHELR